VSAVLTPRMATECGLAARVQGLRRYYALLLCDNNKVRLVKALDGDMVLAETEWEVVWGRAYELSLRVKGSRLQGCVDGRLLFDLDDPASPLTGGGIALLCTEGCLATDAVAVRP